MDPESREDFSDNMQLFFDFVKKVYYKMDEIPALSGREPGYLKSLLPDDAPLEPEKLSDIFEDFEKHILTGITNWQGPNFHAYFPAGRSYPSLMGAFLADLLGVIGFTWTSMSETTLMAMLVARNKIIQDINPEAEDEEKFRILSKLIAYTSDQAHSSVERAGLLAMIKFKIVNSNESRRVTGEDLVKVIEEDKARGLIPFFFVATLGTTGSCAFDCLETCGKVCENNNIWMHVDAAYAGSAFICPEYQHYLNGVQYAMSYAFNPHKWMLVNFDCTVSWFKNINYIYDSFNVNPYYLQHAFQKEALDFRIPLGRRFRSLKIWFVLRCYGVEKIQGYIRRQNQLALDFADLLMADERFELVDQVRMALVCFRLKKENYYKIKR